MRRVLLALTSMLTLVLATVTAVGGSPPAAAATTSSASEVHRITGSDSVSVAAQASQMYPSGQAVTFVVAADAYADAMVAATRAGGINAPVLLVHTNSIPAATQDALQRLDSRRIVLVGGSGTVSDAVFTQLGSYARSGVERVSGLDRYILAANMAKKHSPGVERLYVAAGTGYADALAGAALAGHEGAPMLLTHSRIDSATVAQLQRLKPREIVVLGGTGVVPTSVADQLSSYAPTVRRIAGDDRYATAAAITREFATSSNSMYVANGSAYADAAVGATMSGRTGRPLVLTQAASVPASTRAAIDHRDPSTIYALGTRQAISDGTITALGGEVRTTPAAPSQPPSSGTAMLGGYLGAPGENPDERFNQSFGQWPDLASTYYQAEGRGGGTINRAYEQARIDRGTIPVLTVTSANGPYTMRQIGSGAADGWIDYWAKELAALDGEVWFTFDHEFEVKLNQNRFSPTPGLNDYVNAFNRFQERVTSAAPNVEFVYWYGYSDQAKIDAIGAGIDRPDIIAIDPYVFSHHGAATTFEQMAQPKLDWLRSRGWYDGQPIIFAEFAKDTVHGDRNVADFLTDLRPRMDRLGVAGALYFSRDKPGDVMADLTKQSWPASRQAFRDSVTGG